MDTRRKIVTFEQAAKIARQSRVRLVSGYFDPLLASHAERFAEIRAAAPDTLLVAIVLDPPTPILPSHTRSELVASLRMVDYVICGPMHTDLPANELIHEEPADLERSRNLIEHVYQRHAS